MKKFVLIKKRFRSKTRSRRNQGFTLIESLVAMALLSVALVGLIQLFALAILSNSRADRMSNGLFLAQQKIEYLRNLTLEELNNDAFVFPDENINVNGDLIIDYRRLTTVQPNGLAFEIRVLVFPGENASVSAADLTADPFQYKVLADINTVVTR